MVTRWDKNFKLISWNVNGMGDKLKRGIVLQFIKRHLPDVAFLQETHLIGNSCQALNRWGYTLAVHAGFTSGSRGVGILLRRNFPLVVERSETDPQGRFAVLSGRWEGRTLSLVTVYMPPGLQTQSYHDLGKLLLSLPEGQLIVGGDFNAVVSGTLDRHPPRDITPGQTWLSNLLEACGLVDIWRTRHPTQSQYTFFSGPHRSFSRLDYILTPLQHDLTIQEIKHLARGISDHSPVWVHLTIGSQRVGCIRPINPWFLHNPTSRKQISQSIEHYFQENSGTVDSPTVLWEAFKTVIRGEALSAITGQRKEKEAQLLTIESDLLTLERDAQMSDNPEVQHRMQLKATEYKALVTDAAKQLARQREGRLYDQGDKAGKLIAWLDKKRATQRVVSELRTESGTLLTELQEIASEFAAHYRRVYTTGSMLPEEDSRTLLADIKMPTLSEQDKESLEGALTVDELAKGIKELRPGKALGPNGIPIELYKLKPDLLSHHLKSMFEDCRELGKLPRDQRIATLVAVPKDGKPKELTTSYRPISLLNAEPKILAKLLANRLKPILTKLIHPDQSGFMPHRNTALNLRRLHGVLGRCHTIQEDAIVVSLDATMAFNTLEWTYMMAVLKKLGFGPTFIGWVRLLYSEPLAQVVINNKISEIFTLGRGTRQGCPLSPLLFALSLEPLAAWIRQDRMLRGLKWAEGWEDRISLYADDVLLYLASPFDSLRTALNIFTNFGKNSGYRINWGKSLLYVLHGDPPSIPLDCPIKIATDGFTYLGIFITHDPKIRYERNLTPPLQRFKRDTATWKQLPLSLLGRAALFKMMALPRFLYALQNYPEPVPQHYFAEIEATQRTLLWATTPRISLGKLTRGWYDGGIALPDIQKYYWAAHLTAINQGTYSVGGDPGYEMDRWLLPGG